MPDKIPENLKYELKEATEVACKELPTESLMDLTDQLDRMIICQCERENLPLPDFIVEKRKQVKRI